MMRRRSFLCAAGTLAALAAVPASRVRAAQAGTVYMSPACGCCEQWLRHMGAAGWLLDVRKLGDVVPTKRRLGVPEALWSCHTASIGGYVIEGHVPAADIRRLLRERAPVKGLAVPGMVNGSPGMEQGKPEPYATLAFDDAGWRVYARH